MTKTMMIARAALPLTELACDKICDTLIALIDADKLNLPDARLLMILARLYDRHDSFHAAHIRDTLRDNIPELLF